jgi:Flp pilus assembly protein TadD
MASTGKIRPILVAALCFLVVNWNGIAKAANTNDGICDNRADYYLGIEDYPQAARYHRELLAAHSDDALAHYHLGFAYGMMGRRGGEIAEYRKAAALGLADWGLYLNLGRAYLERGDLDPAVDALRKAAALGPNHPEAHFNLALAYERRGMLAPARQELESSLKLDPRQPDALNMLGLVYAEEGDYAHARQIWSGLAHDDPGFRPARANLAILNVTDGRSGWQPSGGLPERSPSAGEHPRTELSSAAWR